MGGETLFALNAIGYRTGSPSPIRLHANIRYGKAFQGVKHATFISPDGKVLTGEIDDRRIMPFTIGSAPSSVTFADGNPPPTVTIERDAEDAIKHLFERAREEYTRCSFNSEEELSSASLPAVFLRILTGTPAYAQGEDHGHSSNPRGSSGCLAVKGGCVATGASVLIAAGAGCGATFLGYWACFSAAAVLTAAGASCIFLVNLSVA